MMILERVRLGGPPWPTLDPFLFCVHHKDDYPRANGAFGPATSLAGRNIGSDFSGKDGFSMYHGDVVPGFPSHPHRGFETVTLARNGFIDHSDSLGAKARFGDGDVQWMTAGAGIQHAEMFPLLHKDRDNPVELFQIWLNLPASDKMVPPYFTMLWSETIPAVEENGTLVTMVCGAPKGIHCPDPPPSSWASREQAEVAIWTLVFKPGAKWTIPAASAGLNRALYTIRGGTLHLDGTPVGFRERVRVKSDAAITIENRGDQESEILMLQGRPIGEPVAQYGPFVMNTRAELEKAFDDYQRTRFGGWPWKRSDPVHGLDGRFAIHADGTKEKPV